MNKHKFINASLDWLVEKTSNKSDFNPELRYQNITYPIPQHQGEAHGQMILTRDGFSLYSASHRYVKNVEQRFLKLGEIQVNFDEESLYIETHTGIVIHQEQSPRTEFKINPGQAAFYHSKKIQFIPLHDTNRMFNTIALSTPISQLRRMFDDVNIDRLLNALTITKAPSINITSIDPATKKLLDDAFTTKLSGKMREIHIQSRVLEFLCEIIQNSTKSSQDYIPSNNHQHLIKQIHNELINLKGKLPRLSELSRKTGIRQGELNKLFEKEYGLPIHRFIQQRRLIEAHEIIQTTKIPLKQLSDRLGYSHVNHFNSAFSKYFGYPPGILRREK